MTYGIMTERDYTTMDTILSMVNEKFPEGVLHTFEVGVHRGFTSRGIREFFVQKKRFIFHTGIDNENDIKGMKPPFDGCHLIIGNSMDVYNQLRDRSQHFGLLDGCHSYAMTMIDFLLYSDKIAMNGILAFHDTGYHIKPFTDYQGSGSKEDPDNFISCRKAIDKLGLLIGSVHGWKKIIDLADENFPTGGITAFQRYA